MTAPGPMKATVDLTRCSGIGMCEMLASQVFEVTDEGQARVLVSEVPADQADAVREAVSSCPTGALAVS